ncbi:hypothetical protein Nm8I071_41090 [Nonomuraea sp. TT08I-71]|nr:hypothetical protein Nm8I071_41090 [Nonomuraea sp. TT08I-71]
MRAAVALRRSEARAPGRVPGRSGAPVLYLASCLHDAIDDLHRLNPSVTGSAADMFDRFLGWPARHTHAYRVSTPTDFSIEEAPS